MSLYQLIRSRKQRKRLKEILHVFYEEEFGYFITKIMMTHHLPFHKRIKARISREKKTSHPIRLRQAFERLGPTFIKFGQLLSLRPDLVPYKFIAEFEKMQDHVPAFPFSEAKKIIEEELGSPLNKVFTSFDKKPIASASIAQVYKAKIGKQTVAVKVQRPNIRKIVEEDISIMYQIVGLLEHHMEEIRKFCLKDVVHEFEKWTVKELNFNIEAYYAQKIAKNFIGSKILKIPKIYKNYSTSKVLVMEFLDGIPLHNIEEIKKKKINLKRIIKNGYYVALKQVFVDGFFHADPHPGNMLIMKDGKIGLIDFGILGHFDKKLKKDSLDLLQSFINNDSDKAIKVLLRMNPSSDLPESFDGAEFNQDVKNIFEELQCTPMEQLQIGPLIRQTIEIANKHRIRIPTDFVLYGKTIATVEGIALRYQPDFDFHKETKDVLKKLLDYKFFVKETADRTKSKLYQYKEFAENFPDTAMQILEKAKKFKINLDVGNEEVKALVTEMEKSSGNIALGFIVASLIVGSSLIMQTDKWPLLSSAIFVTGAVLGAWLIRHTLFGNIKMIFNFLKK
ncbi:MAG: AarF/ABC1/UbiB kinase family protein [Nanoarchaeota archaeon]|nr:AarF/ABC1/UbiB kinase family protein [Nanoarchaeota archaeon]MBU1622183.1 AarF/ABC1/UbiB kinase family protein [Nanoarchaeota archaeon]MBU1974732.1 AarF/ABC1/UbiB kinase family protein [Nanoarchaeota archaeon]